MLFRSVSQSRYVLSFSPTSSSSSSPPSSLFSPLKRLLLCLILITIVKVFLHLEPPHLREFTSTSRFSSSISSFISHSSTPSNNGRDRGLTVDKTSEVPFAAFNSCAHFGFFSFFPNPHPYTTPLGPQDIRFKYNQHRYSKLQYHSNDFIASRDLSIR